MDQAIFHVINEQWTNRVLDLFMAAISASEIWKPFFAMIFLIALIFGGFKARACILLLIICLLITEQVTAALKSAIGRSRPKQVETVRMVQLQRTHPALLTLFHQPTIRLSNEGDRNRSGPSFPSGHVTTNTVIASCLTVFYRRRGAIYWIVAAAVGYSRIYLGAHWPSDVAATFFLAVGETLVLLALAELLWRFVVRKGMPQFFLRHPSLVIHPAS